MSARLFNNKVRGGEVHYDTPISEGFLNTAEFEQAEKLVRSLIKEGELLTIRELNRRMKRAKIKINGARLNVILSGLEADLSNPSITRFGIKAVKSNGCVSSEYR